MIKKGRKEFKAELKKKIFFRFGASVFVLT
jgi:hypothetical protein